MSDLISSGESELEPQTSKQTSKPPLFGEAEHLQLEPPLLHETKPLELLCPTCGQPYTDGEPICTHCQTMLVQDEQTRSLSDAELADQRRDQWPSGDVFLDGRGVFFSVNEHEIRLPTKKILIIGRTTGNGEPNSPDVDLAPFQAKERGVSRHHAKLTVQDDMLYITDLGSSNGTTLNSRRLTPHAPRLLRSGDDLKLGQLSVSVYFRRE